MKFLLTLFFLTILITTISAQTTVADSALAITDSLAISDSLVVADSLLHSDSLTVKTDTIRPLLVTALGNKNTSFILNSEKSDMIDYRYMGDLFRYIPYGYNFNLGSFRQPNEVTIYGQGYNNISWMLNGISQNSRITNSMDAYDMQLGQADSIEVLPISEGFLYGNFSNQAVVNLITKDKIYGKPLTKIRYHQANNDEALVDVLFSSFITPKLNGVFHFTNTTTNSVFENTNAGSWQTSLRLKYLLHPNFNLFFRYDYHTTNVQMNGGVNRNEIFESDINEIMYSNLEAPVNYPYYGSIESTRYKKNTAHNISLKLINSFGTFIKNDLTLYYQNNLDEMRVNEWRKYDNLPVRIADNKYVNSGANLLTELEYSSFDLQLTGNLENQYITAPALYKNLILIDTVKQAVPEIYLLNYSASGKFTFDFLDNSTISAFAKLSSYDGDFYEGFGGNINLDLFYGFDLYGGIAHFQKPYNQIERHYYNGSGNGETNNLVEAGVKWNYSNINARLGVYFNNTDNRLIPYAVHTDSTFLHNELGGYVKRTFKNVGANAYIDGKLWVIQFFSNLSFTYQDDGVDDELFAPITYTGGIYYSNIHFQRALNLRTGFNFYYNDYQRYFTYDAERSVKLNYYQQDGSLNYTRDKFTRRGFTLDYFLAGEIQEAAIIYFVFENFLNRNHYIVPYYPLQSSGMRFGFSWKLFD